MNTTNLTAQQVQMIQNNNIDSLKKHLQKFDLTSKAIRYLFKNGSPEIKKMYLDISYPMRNEFKLYQTEVVKYADRKTLATFYMYHDLNSKGEIELIKRDEINPFVYYTSSHQLSKKAFKFLLRQGSSQMVEAFLSNNNLSNQQITILLKSGNIDYIQIYIDTATATEREDIMKIVSETKNAVLLHNIYQKCYNCDLVL